MPALAKDSFSNTHTSVEMTCPEDVTGVERIMLAATGNLQRFLSTFFARPISIECVFIEEPTRDHPATPETPIKQERVVNLNCSSRTVCVATSTVTLTSAETERLLLDEKYPIGQLFRKLGCVPDFALLNVETEVIDGRRELRRTYTLTARGIVCEILEVFHDRDMFLQGAAWFQDIDGKTEQEVEPVVTKKDFFAFTPHSVESTPTLSSILDKQAEDAEIGSKSFAAYPRPAEEVGSGQSPYKEITYAEFAGLVSNQASLWFDRLSQLVDTKAGDAPVIAFLGDSGFQFATTVMALLKLNVTVFLLAPANSEAALAHLLNTCGVSVLVHGQSFSAIAQSAAAQSSTPTIAFDEKSINADSASFKEWTGKRVLHPTAPATPIIVHSSGSTSFPKPVHWSQSSFLSNSQVMLTSGGWSAFTQNDNRFLCLGPLFHTMGLTIGLAGTICAGTTIIFPLTHSWPPSPSNIAQSLRATDVKTCIIVPLLLEQLVDALEGDESSNGEARLAPLTKLNLLLTGGAHCPETLANRLTSEGVNLKSVYGSSETGHLMIGSHARPGAGSDSPAWNLLRPFPHTSIIFKPLDPDDLGACDLYQIHMAANDARLASGVLKAGEETWDTGDVVQEVPRGSGWFKLLYRNDDILVHVSGEKTNPVPMETSCRSHKLIESIAIVGHRRSVTAAIVQLNEQEAKQYSADERLSIVRQLIKEANQAAPSHSRVMEEMIMVLQLGSEKSIPRTPKGNCIRPKVLQMFEQEIEAIYREFEGEDEHEDEDGDEASSTSSTVTLADVQEQVTKIVGEVVQSDFSAPDLNKSLFDLGLDSVTAMQLRNRLSKVFGTKLPAQFVYQNFSLSLLAIALLDRVSSRPASPTSAFFPAERTWPDKGDILDGLLERQLQTLRDASNLMLASRAGTPCSTSVGHVVAVVGAAGSLGIWQVKTLLDRADVKQVLCLVRGANAAAVYDKMLSGFQKAGLAEIAAQTEQWKANQLDHPNIPTVNLNQRLVVLPFDLANPHFDGAEYAALAKNLTTIIQTGWKMDFNQVVQGFEKDCLAGTTQLLLLAGFIRPKHFYFVSSIGVVLESQQTPVPETIVPWSKDQHLTASPHGYSESKYVCEYVVKAASELLDIPCSIARVGQIAGDTASGVWKTQEMNPIIIAGSARIGKFPVVPGVILDWTPVDTVGGATIELALAERSPGSAAVHHIVNPTPSTYAEMVDHLREAGVNVAPTSPQEWWDAIQADEGNPCHAIEAYIEEAVVHAQADLARTGGKAVTLDISRTLELAPNTLGRCRPLDGSLWKKYVNHWQEIGFVGN